MQQVQAQTFYFEDDGQIPNHPTLPLLVYSNVLPEGHHRLALCQELFERNSWSGTWFASVFDYHHYHSTAHEVLGVVNGEATIRFGGEKGEPIQVQAGDVVVIPAGVGHCNERSSDNFRVVGAYPIGQRWDLCTGAPEERPQVLENIRQVPLPQTDPVYGMHGPLLETWYEQER
jgi:uncharacterized protein YjlB